MRVLVIDDNPDDRQLVLREAGALFPGLEAVEPVDLAGFEAALAAAPPDLVVTDLDLRWWSGRDVLAAVRARHPACPVVMFTGSGDEQTAADLMRAGLDDYVVKSPRQLPRLRASLKLAVDGARTRAALAAALEHKDTVIRELHHRVKNNLQTMTALLQLRGHRADAATRALLDDVADRVRALGAVQARIYETEDLDRVDFRAALEDIARSLTRAHGNGSVRLAFSADGSPQLKVDRAMPLALLCHELVLNALKHAWPEGRKGRLRVTLRAKGRDRPEIVIADDGVGFAGDAVVRGTGSRLVEALAAEAQVTVETVSRPGDGATVALRLA